MILKQFHQGQKSAFKKEIRVFNELEGSRGFPKMYSSMSGSDSYEILMQKLGQNLNQVIKCRPDKKLDSKLVYKLCSQLVSTKIFEFLI